MRYLTMALAALTLTACASSTRYASPCQRPADLPDRGLTVSEAAFFWAADRQALAECGVANGVIE